VPWGYGAPTWALVAGGTNTPSIGFPICNFGTEAPENISLTFPNKLAKPPYTTIPVETDVAAAFDAFWENTLVGVGVDKLGLWVHYGAMLQFVAEFLSGQQGNILGYDPFNEPTPGKHWTEAYIPPAPPNDTPMNFANGCPTFDARLAKFYEQSVIPNLRKGHPQAIIWFESNVLHGLNAPSFLPDLGFQNLGFNFHNYDSPTYKAPVTNAINYQEKYPIPLLCSEFGATTNPDVINTIQVKNDQYMFSAIYWAYFNNPRYKFAPTGGALPSDPRSQAIVRDMSEDLWEPNVNHDVLTALTHVYPRVVAGTPIAFSYNPDKKTFHLQYSTGKPPDGKEISQNLTSIVVPRALYPSGYTVSVTNGSVQSQDAWIVNIAAKPSSSPITVDVDIKGK
jgi:endoglycosylceramidase